MCRQNCSSKKKKKYEAKEYRMNRGHYLPRVDENSKCKYDLLVKNKYGEKMVAVDFPNNIDQLFLMPMALPETK